MSQLTLEFTRGFFEGILREVAPQSQSRMSIDVSDDGEMWVISCRLDVFKQQSVKVMHTLSPVRIETDQLYESVQGAYSKLLRKIISDKFVPMLNIDSIFMEMIETPIPESSKMHRGNALLILREVLNEIKHYDPFNKIFALEVLCRCASHLKYNFQFAIIVYNFVTTHRLKPYLCAIKKHFVRHIWRML